MSINYGIHNDENIFQEAELWFESERRVSKLQVSSWHSENPKVINFLEEIPSLKISMARYLL